MTQRHPREDGHIGFAVLIALAGRHPQRTFLKERAETTVGFESQPLGLLFPNRQGTQDTFYLPGASSLGLSACFDKKIPTLGLTCSSICCRTVVSIPSSVSTASGALLRCRILAISRLCWAKAVWSSGDMSVSGRSYPFMSAQMLYSRKNEMLPFTELLKERFHFWSIELNSLRKEVKIETVLVHVGCIL